MRIAIQYSTPAFYVRPGVSPYIIVMSVFLTKIENIANILH